MTWLPRRPSVATDDPGGATSALATEFGSLVDRSFPIDDAALVRMRAQVLGVFIEAVPSSSRRRGRGTRAAWHRPRARRIPRGARPSGAVVVEALLGGAFYPVSLAIESATLLLDAPRAGRLGSTGCNDGSTKRRPRTGLGTLVPSRQP